MIRIEEIWLQKQDLIKLLEWVKENEPYEACALLLGKFTSNTAIVEEIVLTANTSPSPISFEIDPEVLLKVLLDAEEKKKALVSIFHSHPARPSPSGIDIPYMQYNSQAVWLIKGRPNTEPIRGYQWYQNSVVEVKVIITH